MIYTRNLITNIYGLYNEFDQIRYVGLTKNPLNIRYNQHIRSAKNYIDKDESSHCLRWIRSMLKKGLTPTIKLITIVPGNGEDAERFYIAYYKMLGANLTNLTNGGDGTIGYTRSDETNKKSVETRKRHGLDKPEQESINKMIKTRKDNNSYVTGGVKSWITSRENGTVESRVKKTKETISKNGSRAITHKKIIENRRKNGTNSGWKWPIDSVKRMRERMKRYKPSSKSIQKRFKTMEINKLNKPYIESLEFYQIGD